MLITSESVSFVEGDKMVVSLLNLVVTTVSVMLGSATPSKPLPDIVTMVPPLCVYIQGAPIKKQSPRKKIIISIIAADLTLNLEFLQRRIQVIRAANFVM